MPDVEFDMSELEDFEKRLMDLATDKMPKEADKFLRREGSKLKTRTKAQARASINTKYVNKKYPDGVKYIQGITRGRPYEHDDDRTIRVFGKARHTHLIDKGHRVVVSDTIRKQPRKYHAGFDTGKKTNAYGIYEMAEDAFRGQFNSDCRTFIEDVVEKGLT